MQNTESTPALDSPATAPHLALLRASGFLVRETVAAGRFGVIYRATDLTTPRDVAVKVIDLEALRPTQGPHSEFEIAALATLRHPHVVPLYQAGTLDGAVRFFVMPWIDGASLRRRLRAERRLSVVESLRVGVGIADALVALHARGLIHRDVKPENVLFDGRHAVLIDFGLVCAVHDAALPNAETDPVVGTPAYMAPEQWRRGGAIDGRTDIYGLGCLLYESLTGVSPTDEVHIERPSRTAWRWSDTQPTEDSAQMAHAPLRANVRLRAHRKDAPAELERLLRSALRMDPDNRIASAEEFRDGLERLLASQIASSRPAAWLHTRP